MCFFAAPLAVGAAAGAAGTIGGGIATTAALNTALATGIGLGNVGAAMLAPAAFAIPTWVTPALTLLGAGASAYSSVQQGRMMDAAAKADQIAANAQADQLDVNAGQERASAQRAAIEDRRRVGLAISRARALGAASGATGAGLADIESDLAAEGDFRFRTALASGENRAQQLETTATMRRYGGTQALDAGRAQRSGANMAAAGTLAGSVGSTLLRKYG